MHPKAGPSDWYRSRNRHFNTTSTDIEQLEEGRGRAVRQDGTVPAGKYGSHPAAFEWKVSTTHRVDALVDTVEPPACYAGLCRPVTQAKGK